MKTYIATRLLYALAIAAILTGCGIAGIHINLQNPKKAGKYPRFTEADYLRGTLTPLRSSYDVNHYGINITVDPEKKYLKGYVDFVATATADLDSLQVDLYNNMKINSIERDGKQLGFRRKEHAVFIGMPAKVRAGEKIVFRVSYEGKPIIAAKPPWAGGFVWKKDDNKKHWIGVACEGDGASMWWPCKDHLSDEPDSTAINITVPAGLMCVANGRLRDSIPSGAQTTYKWFVSKPINNYNVTIYVGDFRKLHDTYTSKLTGKTLDLDHYVLPYNYEKAQKHFRQLKPQLDFYEKYFGEYPWYEDGFKLVESPYAGMEHQSAIAYGNGYKNNHLGFDYIVLHEAAHEWWGNSVTNIDFADIWIHEGFATYCEALYVEHSKGYDQYISYLFQQRIFIRNQRPVVGPTGVNYFNYKDSDPYMKGSWILHTLRTVIGNDPVFLDILKSFAIAYREKQVNSQDFINLVNSKTGKDYSWFFKQYLNNRKVPVLEYALDGKGKIYYRWAEVADDFSMPVKLKMGPNSFTITPTSKVQSSDLPYSDAANTELTFPLEKMLIIKDEVKLKKLQKAK
jgi:aminopeptidase N